ncbi:MAG: aldehyde dehydrogenase family protein [Rhodocyclaceae bacterium]|jgi:aldehyde dehydrogenase (NAD+)|nr:aldehyde dehydrogenase family protein [Rhodocyclaceae bacterium]
MSNPSPAELKRIFDQQKNHQWTIKATTAAQRKQKLQKFKDAVQANADGIRRALATDLRKPASEAEAEIAVVIGDIDEAIAHLDEWMKPVQIESSPQLAGTKATMVYEPRGVCLVFGAWNFPFLLLLQPLVPAIAAGNCVIAKPNEMAPATSAISAKVLREAFDEREVAVVEGGIELANALLELPFDHIFFTGSPKVGRAVMAAAAKHLTSVTLELGGKCPAVVDRASDLPLAAATIAAGRCFNAGQVCLCPDIAWVREELADEFVKQASAFIEGTYYAEGKLNKQAFARIVDKRNFERVKGYLDDATKRGANVAYGGKTEADDLTIHPTILRAVPLDATIMKEEVFGPLLTVATYRDINDITAFMRRGGKPLAMYVFSTDQAFIDRMMLETSSGGVTVNGWATHFFESRLPFGGVNESGIGRYHGIHGFKELSHERAMLSVPAAA